MARRRWWVATTWEVESWRDAAPHLTGMSDAPPLGSTDLRRWRLRVSDGGRHVWHYLETDEEADAWPQTQEDKYWLGLEMVRALPSRRMCRRSPVLRRPWRLRAMA